MFSNPDKQQFAFYLLLLGAIVVSRLPFIGKYLRVVHTLVHEWGHAIVAMLSSGDVQSIELFSNTEGTATTRSSSKFSQFFQAMAGYPIASLAAYLFFYWIGIGRAIIPLYVILALGLVCLVLFIRNIYGVFWLVTFCALLFYLIYRNVLIEEHIAAVIISSLILIDSFIYPFHLLIIAIRNPGQAGDAKNLATLTHIPSVIWALVFVVISCFITYKTVLMFPPIRTL